MDDLHLYNTPLCPYAHRVRIVLSEKALPARIIAVDLNDKPAELLRISPAGKVPALQHGKHTVHDSSVINEYLDAAFAAVPMMPRDLASLAWARRWISFADLQLYEHTLQLLHGRDPGSHARWLAAIENDLLELEAQAFGATGPYWLGRNFSLVDATYYPWFEQFPVLQAFFGLRWPAACKRLAQWRDAVADRPSVAAIAQPAEYYLRCYGELRAQLA